MVTICILIRFSISQCISWLPYHDISWYMVYYCLVRVIAKYSSDMPSLQSGPPTGGQKILHMNWPRLGPCPLSCSSVFLYSAVRQAGQAEGYPFYPRPVLAFGYCRCLRLSVCPSVRPCVNHEFVRAITHHPFKLGSPNLDHRCKRPWLRSLLFLGVTFKVKFNFKVKIYPILSLSMP